MASTTVRKKATVRRYTKLSLLKEILRSKQITFSNPKRWTDRNDSRCLGIYCAKMRIAGLHVLCFTKASERIHFWSDYAKGSDGVCLHLDRDQVTKLWKHGKTDLREVKYKEIRPKGRSWTPVLEDLPFLKRFGYQAEDEVRVIRKATFKGEPTPQLSLPQGMILQITLSPHMSDGRAAQLKKELHALMGQERKIRVVKSRLVESAAWIRMINTAC